MAFRQGVLLLCLSVGLLPTPPSPARAGEEPSPPTPVRVLSLEEALASALHNRPELAALRLDLGAIAEKRTEAGQLPNPELGFELANLASNLDGDEMEATISLRQSIETGGKRKARLHKVEAEALLLETEFQVAWLEVAAEVRLAYTEVQADRERLDLVRETERLAAELTEITRGRVEAGELASIEESRALARLALAGTATAKETRRLSEAEQILAATIGEPAAITSASETRLAEEPELPSLEQLKAGTQSTPSLARIRRERELRGAELAVERSAVSPDPTWFLALRETPDQDGHALALGVSLPLPLFRKNRAGLAEAGVRAARSDLYLAAEERKATGELARSRANFAAALQESRTLRDQVIVRAEEAQQAVLEGYRQGKFRYADVLESSQALVEARLRRLETIVELHRAAVTLDRLAGNPLPTNTHRQERSTP
ncbi:MAG: TolC family protein [Desulfobulbaceae bacterium]|nr:TolC family protein [Desulfobulbaceae bacterium]